MFYVLSQVFFQLIYHCFMGSVTFMWFVPTEHAAGQMHNLSVLFNVCFMLYFSTTLEKWDITACGCDVTLQMVSFWDVCPDVFTSFTMSKLHIWGIWMMQLKFCDVAFLLCRPLLYKQRNWSDSIPSKTPLQRLLFSCTVFMFQNWPPHRWNKMFGEQCIRLSWFIPVRLAESVSLQLQLCARRHYYHLKALHLSAKD